MNLGFCTKVYIGLVLALGSCACIATLPRFAYIGYLKDPRDIFFHTGLVIWSHIEVGISLMASSVATLRPLFAHLRGMCCTGHGQSEKSTGGIWMSMGFLSKNV
ncbi:hypothetical protein MAP00_006637 [Monascus purpureus]|nr:hypothetical protein MAP00_006637 [Monascus purpureus]